MKYDVIVIGGGLGGLMAGITAAKRGKKTLLLEKHVTVGGLAAGFTRKGYYFDAGMSRCMGFSIRSYLKEIGVLEQADLRPHRAIWNVEGHWIDDRRSKAYAFLVEKEDEVDYRGEMSFATKVGKWYTQMFNVYPSAGFQGLADAMAAVFAAHGGEVRMCAAVGKIMIEDGKAVGVEVGKEEGGEEILADNTLCCIDLHKACHQLIGTQHIDADFIARLEKSRLSCAIPLLYLGVNVPPQRIRECFHGHEEVFYYPAIEPSQGEAFFSDHPLVIHSSCLHNPAHAPANKSTVQVYLSCPPADWMDHWGIQDGKRTERYKPIKEMVIGHVLGALESLIPELHDRSLIEVCELGTPFTIERYTGSTDGCALGFRMDEDYINPRKFGKYLERCPGIENLYFAGQQAGYPGGVGIALGSGKHAGELV
jgi:phytoene dehydrogenase-like protein